MADEKSTSAAFLITGASTGIGAACALELDRRGYRVFAGVRSLADAERLQSHASARLTPLRLDVTRADDIAAAAATVDEAVGPAGLAGLVNNAGIVVAGPLELLPLERFRTQLEVNVVGPLAVTQAFLPALRRAKGRIVNIGSANSRIVAPYLGPYSASKHALAAMSRAMHLELRTWGIHVALVEPGGHATPIWDKTLAASDVLERQTPSDAVDMYRADLDAMRTATRHMAASADPADNVVHAVVHALTARRPRVRYPVGFETRLLFRLIKWLPDRLWDRILLRALGMK
jgi:NAD(P)-dependent dehydrogenase (short-subunit alcohol dehydrogenase family)